MIYSMTAFARNELNIPAGKLVMEIRSVNHRFLELNLRLPDMLRDMETEFREMLRQTLSRGKVDVFLRLESQESAASLSLNHALANQISGLCLQLQNIVGKIEAIDPLALLQWPGILEKIDLMTPEVKAAINDFFKTTLDKLLSARQREGQALAEVITERLLACEEKAKQVKAYYPNIILLQRDKLKARLTDYLEKLDENRLEQEIVLLAQKIDIAEELDRLQTHINELRRIFTAGGQVGRRMDFLLQEMNREANTMSSKAIDTDTQHAAVDIKVLLEQIREQGQNIE